jgi:predicted amidohydrolase
MAVVHAGILQMCAGTDPDANAATLAGALDRVAAAGATIAFTPEMTNLIERRRHHLLEIVRCEKEDPCLAVAQAAASRHGMAVALGSLAIRRPDGMVANRAFLIAPNGSIVARYDKMHLFDVELPNGDRYCESASFAAGDDAVVGNAAGMRIGLSICYDVRFPALYGALARAGAQLLSVPAAFTVPTGQAHWHVLLRARAIETGSFVVAAAQSGMHADGRETYGHALVVDPWGRVLADLGDTIGEAVVPLDLALVADARARIPSLAHARPIPPVAGLACG